MRIDELKYVLFSGDGGDIDSDTYDLVYKAWLESWKATFFQLEKKTTLYSDAFTRQQEIGALMYGRECIALSGFNPRDMNLSAHRSDSCFQVWPTSIMDELANYKNGICMVSSYLTIAEGWRKQNVDELSIKDVLMGLLVKRFMESPADALLGTVRNNRGINTLCYRFGAVQLAQDLVHHGVNVDLIAYYKDKVTFPIDRDIREAITVAWENGKRKLRLVKAA